jgi:hypothetical protein
MQVTQESITQWVVAAEDLALLFAGQPEAKVASSLAEVRQNLEAQLTNAGFGVDMHSLLDRFIQTILDRKAEIEQSAIEERRAH